MAAAITGSFLNARTQSSPNCRTRWPPCPSRSASGTPAWRGAPIQSRPAPASRPVAMERRSPREGRGPAPGRRERCRGWSRRTPAAGDTKQKAILMRPLMKNRAEHYDRSASLSPLLVPVARMTTTGPLAANRNATSPLAMLATVRSRKNPARRSRSAPARCVRHSSRALVPALEQSHVFPQCPSRSDLAASSTAGPRGATAGSALRRGRKIRQVAAEGRCGASRAVANESPMRLRSSRGG